MGIGFSVDFSAHVSYHYLAAEEGLAPEARLAHCLYALGPPILQGAITTILSVLPLLRHQSYVIQSFSKMIFLVIFLALVHSLLLLPVLLTLFGPGSCGGSKKRKVSETMLSPSNASLSETFIYKNGKDKCLRKQALTGDGKRRKFIAPEDVVNRNFADDESDEEPISISPSVKLHLSFFKPTESDVSDLNMSTKETVDQDEMSTGRQTQPDSSYYNYQKRHLRRHMKQVPQRHDRLGSRPPSIEKYPELSDERRKSVQSVPERLENMKEAFTKNNNNYQVFSHEKEGSENQGFDDNEVVNQSVNNKSTLSSFKPGDHQSPVESTRKGLKIVFVDHQADVQSESGGDSFDDVELTDESSKLKM
eukprot:GFUD01107363.1.p1 GENE.GFUD01107363.1~~GFUD01107363.1.p1  ORF type:complete len:394 (-),score=71.77 GFUD01107363.1:69-1157(-)